ncbi:MAG TPA: phosphoribosyltransferase family protein [Candidatus Levybacteria bacterium]|nr:phosphoribosyltransferase family protein [Candidatus Levybacteria bacterium]
MDVLAILKKVGAIITDDHFVYTSGLHGAIYINKDALYPHTEDASQVGMLLARKAEDLDVDVVVGPALGGIILSTWTAYHLSSLKNKEILGIYTEKDENKNQVFTRNYDTLVKDKNVLIVEDLTTTGGSVKKVVESVRNAMGRVTAVLVMVNRNPKLVNGETIGAPFISLGELPVETWTEEKCPLCKEGKPINTRVGHGKKYLSSKQK